jgi:low affinity Fe/Cu permease
MSLSKRFGDFATRVAHATGKPLTFLLSVALVVVWGATGPLFHYSDTWQLVINTGTTIITFLMVFLIQSTQNRDGAAIQTKLDELIRASAAQNRYIGIEDLSEEELLALRERCVSRARNDRIEGAVAAGHEAASAVNQRAREAADRASGLA